MHFYAKTENGIEPRHFVPMKSDPSRTRPSTMRDMKAAQKAGEKWFPSVTTILGVLDKPALVNWKVDRHIETAYELITNGIVRTECLEQFLSDVKTETQHRLDEAPKAGTSCHLVLENYFLHGEIPKDEIMLKICENVRDVLKEKVGQGAYECEKYFANELGFAGCADLVAGEWVIDYKTKQTADKFKPGKMAYPEHYRQLAAYLKGFSATKAANIFICLETGEIDFHEHDQKDLENGWLDFEACIGIFNRSKGA
jgi:hypothetical protein